MTARQWVAAALVVIALACACVVIAAEELKPQTCQCQPAERKPVQSTEDEGDGVPIQPTDPCDWEWVQNSAFLRWFYNCPDSSGGGSSGASYSGGGSSGAR